MKWNGSEFSWLTSKFLDTSGVSQLLFALFKDIQTWETKLGTSGAVSHTFTCFEKMMIQKTWNETLSFSFRSCSRLAKWHHSLQTGFLIFWHFFQWHPNNDFFFHSGCSPWMSLGLPDGTCCPLILSRQQFIAAYSTGSFTKRRGHQHWWTATHAAWAGTREHICL